MTHPTTPIRRAFSRRQFGVLLGAGALGLQARAARAAAPIATKTAKVASGLYELVVSPADNLLYVAAAGPRGEKAAKILGLDLQTLETRSTIPLGEDTALGLGLNNRTGTLFGTDSRGSKLLVVDLHSGTVKARISSGEEAHCREVLVDEANNRAFVSIFGARGKPSAIWVVDTATNTISTTITEGLDGGIAGLAFDPKGDRLFAAALMSNEVVEVSLSRKAGVRRFASGGEGPIELALDPASGRLYVTNEKSGQFAVLDSATGQAVKVLETGAGALGVALSADGALAYVANRGAGTVSVVDTRALSITGSVPTGTHPNTVAVDVRSGLAYVTNKAATGERDKPAPEDPNGDTVSIIKA